MDRTTLINFFEEVETTEEYNGYFAASRKPCSISPEAMLNLPGGDAQSGAEYSNTKPLQLPPFTVMKIG